MDDIKLNADDVRVLSIPPATCGHCNESTATHYVELDMRTTGQATEVTSGCKECCEDFAERLRSSLGDGY
jgi:hypothetical protein